MARLIRCLDCPTITPRHSSGRCPSCRSAREKARGSASARGYGVEHKSLRAEWAPMVAAGTVQCARCGDLIITDQSWDLDHRDDDRTQYLGPSHASCNRATAGRAER